MAGARWRASNVVYAASSPIQVKTKIWCTHECVAAQRANDTQDRHDRKHRINLDTKGHALQIEKTMNTMSAQEKFRQGRGMGRSMLYGVDY